MNVTSNEIDERKIRGGVPRWLAQAEHERPGKEVGRGRLAEACTAYGMDLEA